MYVNIYCKQLLNENMKFVMYMLLSKICSIIIFTVHAKMYILVIYRPSVQKHTRSNATNKHSQSNVIIEIGIRI